MMGLGHPMGRRFGLPLPTALGTPCLAWFDADGDFEPVAAETYNPDMSHADWAQTGIASVVGGQSDPDGGSNAYIITENTGTSEHFVDEASPGADTNLIDATVWLKAGTSTEGRLNVGTLSGSSQGAIITALNATPVIAVTGSARVYRAGTSGSWHKFRVFAEVDTQRMRVQLTSAGAASYTGTSRTLYAYAPAGSYRARVVQDADGVSPDITSWTKSPAGMGVAAGQSDPFGGTDAYLITDTTDGAPAAHRVEDATPNVIVGRTVAWDVWLAPGTKTQAEVLIGTFGGSATACVINLTTGEITSTSGGLTAAHIADGEGAWRKYRLQGAPDAITRARVTLVSSGSGSYTGTGTGTIYVYTPLGSYQQKRVHRWQGVGSVAASARRAKQDVDANRPILRRAFNGKWGLSFDGLSNYLTAHPLMAAYDFSASPWSLILLVEYGATPGAPVMGTGANAISFSHSAQNDKRHLERNTSNQIRTTWVDPTSNYTHQTVAVGGRYAVALTNDSNRSVYVDGVKFASDPRANGAPSSPAIDQLTIGAWQGFSTIEDHENMIVRELAFFNRELADHEIRLLSAGMRVRGGLAVL
jgi:hypothetical protein